MSKNVNWTNVGIAAGEGALTSGVSAFKGLGAKVAISAVTSAAKNVSDQIKNGAKSYKDIDYVNLGVETGIGAFITGTSGKYAKIKTKQKFKNVVAKPTSKATMHRRAGQMRYSKSTRKNARSRLKKEKNNYLDKRENIANAILSGIYSFIKRIW